MDEPVTHCEDREQQAAVSRLLLYHLNTPLSEGCRLLGVLPAPAAVRIAVHAGGPEEGITFLYEIPHDVVAPAYVPGILRTTLAGTQLYSSADIGEVMGMTLIRLHPERITPAPESEEERALVVLRALSDPGEDEDPFLIGFLMRGDGLLRLYVRHPDGTRVIGADIRPADALTALIASLPSLVAEEERHRPSPDDPHCDVLVDLTDR